MPFPGRKKIPKTFRAFPRPPSAGAAERPSGGGGSPPRAAPGPVNSGRFLFNTATRNYSSKGCEALPPKCDSVRLQVEGVVN
ncbi:hypothetical protein EVAR_49542_1 [Eumeta japonica]|uniref:Uncharacterized protein n=1 Tax=Eumeta variegata TaxID=151549 RepID=A0A4C1XMI2_EUMVA|nr:hypothetical protein EVAR_49542_1 [Eumeta japonica]